MVEEQKELTLASGYMAPVAEQMAKMLVGTVLDYQELLVLYDCAIKTVHTKFDIINAEYRTKHQRNPIHSISTRLKRTSSIVQKLQRQNAEMSVENIQKLIHDVAGVRVVCSYLDDVYDIAAIICAQEDVKLIRQKDYISNPKHNGYRSLHLVISIPVSFDGQTQWVEVEVQIRTIAMDFWASLEHQLKYKRDIEDEAQIIERLRVCAETIAKTDTDMLAIRRSIERGSDMPTEEELMLERFRNIDITMNR